MIVSLKVNQVRNISRLGEIDFPIVITHLVVTSDKGKYHINITFNYWFAYLNQNSLNNISSKKKQQK